MSPRNEKRGRGREPTLRPMAAEGAGALWAREQEGEPWHADSSLPASEVLSDLPEPLELEEPELLAESEEEDEDAGGEVDGESDAAEARPSSADARRRSKTIARKQMLRERRRMLAEGSVPEILDYDRPGTREVCREEKRPCLYVSCRYHLYLDVNPLTGSIKINFPDKEVWELEETCALDVAERGGITLEEVGEIMNLTRERIRQVEVSGLDKLRSGEVALQTFLDGRELEVGGPTLHGHRLLPVLED